MGEHGDVTIFFQGNDLGLTAALGVLHAAVILVGSLPTTDGASATVVRVAAVDDNGNTLSIFVEPIY